MRPHSVHDTSPLAVPCSHAAPRVPLPLPGNSRVNVRGRQHARPLLPFAWPLVIARPNTRLPSKHVLLQSSLPRSYNILLSERAVTAIEAAGADMTGFDVTDIKASMRHK